MCLIVAEPVAWILLNDKHARTYTLVFKALKKAALRLKLKLKTQRFITDFESGIIKAVRQEVGRYFSSLKIDCLGSFFFFYKSQELGQRIFLLFIFSSAVLYIKVVSFTFYNALTKN
jgi:hypothetical protein